MILEQAIRWGKQHTRKLFLADAIGAVLSAILSGVVLVALEKMVGIPSKTLYFLASLPLLFAVYDCYCYLANVRQLARFLKSIAVINILYCVLSLALAMYHRHTITLLGCTYVVVEMLIVTTLAYIEYRVANTI